MMPDTVQSTIRAVTRRPTGRWSWSRSLLWLVVAVVAAAVAMWIRSRPAVIAAAQPLRELVTETIAVSGRVQGAEETAVFAMVPGRLSHLFVREGDIVRAYQVLGRIDDRVGRSEMRSAEATVHTARAQLALASAPTRESEIARVRADAAQAVHVSRARLAAARQRLSELERGATAEELQAVEAAQSAAAELARAAGAAEAQARSRKRQAELDWERLSSLSAQGAASRSDADRALTARDEATAALAAAAANRMAAQHAEREADARLRNLRAGTRKEVIAQARADVAAADAAAHGAEASGAAQVRTLELGPRHEEVRVARARLAEAERVLGAARQRLAQLSVTAPVSGRVTRVLAYPGAYVSASLPLLRIVPSDPLEVLLDVDENYLGKLRVGQEAVLTSEAYPGRSAPARISRVGYQVDADTGSVQVWVTPARPEPWLRPGQTVSVNIVLARARPLLTVPITAVTRVGGRAQVLVVEGGVVRTRDVDVAPAGAERVPIVRGLDTSSIVVADAGSARPGQRAAPQPTPGGNR